MKKNILAISGIKLSLLIFLLLHFALASAQVITPGPCSVPTDITSEVFRTETSPVTFEARINWTGFPHSPYIVELYIGGIRQRRDIVTSPTIYYTNLKADTYYNIHLRTPCSETVGYEFLTPALCGPVENFNVTGNTNSFTATWDYPFTARFDYKVYEYLAGRLVTQGSTTDHTIAINGLFPNVDYRVVIQAFCDPANPDASGYFEAHFVTQCAVVSNVEVRYTRIESSPVTFAAGLQWSGGAYRGSYELILTGGDSEITGSIGSPSVTFDSLKSDTEYTLQIRTHCNGAPSDWVTYTFRTPVVYCYVTSTPGGYAIHEVKLNSIDNISYGSYNGYDNSYGYGNYTNLSTTLTEGETYTLRVSAAGESQVLRYFAAWIDYNQDADFDDTGERVALVSSANNTEDLNFTVPYVDSVTTTIRVVVKNNSSGTEAEPTPCGSNPSAEIEDYTVVISPSAVSAGARQINIEKKESTTENNTSVENVLLYPNPVRDVLTVNGPIDVNTELIVVNQAGQTLFTSSSSRLEVSSLAPGIYNILIMQNGQRKSLRFLKH